MLSLCNLVLFVYDLLYVFVHNRHSGTECLPTQRIGGLIWNSIPEILGMLVANSNLGRVEIFFFFSTKMPFYELVCIARHNIVEVKRMREDIK